MFGSNAGNNHIKAVPCTVNLVPNRDEWAEDVQCSRESLYKSLSYNGNPSFETIIKVMSAMGYVLKPVHV